MINKIIVIVSLVTHIVFGFLLDKKLVAVLGLVGFIFGMVRNEMQNQKRSLSVTEGKHEL